MNSELEYSNIQPNSFDSKEDNRSRTTNTPTVSNDLSNYNHDTIIIDYKEGNMTKQIK